LVSFERASLESIGSKSRERPEAVANSNKLAYLCAGASIGGALAILFAPKPGAQTRQRLHALGERGIDEAIGRVHDIQDAYAHRGEMIEAGKKRLADSIEIGREAYRETAAETHPAPSLGAVGVLALGTAAAFSLYSLSGSVRKNVHGVVPKLEGLLEASRDAVIQNSDKVSALASKAHGVLSAIEGLIRR
jgi:gas vesicle protein